MSIIPKIKVSLPKKREKINLNFDCSTTGNIGTLQPTMCREMVPGETFHVSQASIVRLLALSVPTFGRMSLRNYHVFIPYKDLWEPFDCMMSGQPYVAGGTSYVPASVPQFYFNDITKYIIMNYSEVSCYPKDDLGSPITFDPADMSTLTACQDAWDALRTGALFGMSSSSGFEFNSEGRGSTSSDGRGFINFGNYGFFGAFSETTLEFVNSATRNIEPFIGGRSVVTYEGADFITNCGNYTFCFKLRPVAKRVRQIFIGLGYQFSPYNNVSLSVLKLLAYYKGWFELFRPKRQKNFNMTNCYNLIHDSRLMNYNGTNFTNMSYWKGFLFDLATDCMYYLPMDYFAMSQLTPNQVENLGEMQKFSLETNAAVPTSSIGAFTKFKVNSNGDGQNANTSGSVMQQYQANQPSSPSVLTNPLAMKMAMRILSFTNKNSVVGRSVRDYMRTHFGVVAPEETDNAGVYRIGSSRINVSISDVMATAETQLSDGKTMPLGGFAGKGIGFGKSETFDYTAQHFGVWICYSVIVPESGYYQGYLRENRHFTRFDFFTPEFDALGYQMLEKGEIIDDYNCDGDGWHPRTAFNRSQGFGLVPRYSEYKVGRNIVNGDLSLIGMYNSMAPYTLDRRFPAGAIGYTMALTADGANYKVQIKPKVVAPGFVPSVVYDDFRRIDPTDHLGQYNRIFSYGLNDIDHFIIHNVFDVSAIAPMKSLSTSFDTIQEGENTIDVTKA